MVFSKYKTDGFWLTWCGYYDNTSYTQYTLLIRVLRSIGIWYHSHMNFEWYAYMRMFHAYLWMFPSHLLPHQPKHIHPERNPQRGGRRFAPPPFRGFLYGWMCVGWWGSRCDGNIHKYAWNMRMYAYHSEFMWLWYYFALVGEQIRIFRSSQRKKQLGLV